MLHSSIEKAKFTFSHDNKWGQSSTVMYNPSELTIKLDRKVKSRQGTGSEKNTKPTINSQPMRSISLSLIFDLVEKFEKAKQVESGSYSSLADKVDFTDDDVLGLSSNIHIFNPNMCCYKLIYDAFKEDAPVKFRWGKSIEVIGKITDFSASWTYFSTEGNPLRAKVDLSITREDVGIDNNN